MKKHIYKYLIISILCVICTASGLKAQDTLWTRANGLYAAGEFNDALNCYNKIEESGAASSDLYYNMGNAYYRLNQVGRAILYYEKALKADPSNADAKANLAIANNLTVDKIDAVPEFVALTWLRQFRNTLSSASWACLALVFLCAALVCLLLFRFASSLFKRKFSFIIACILGFCAIVSFSFGAVLASASKGGGEAVVVSSFGNVKSAPNTTGNSVFVLHEGTKVSVLERVEGWCRIEIRDGRQGWLTSVDLATI